MGNTEFGGGAFLALTYKDMLALRLEGNYFRLSASDSVLANVPKTDIARARYNRNLSFRTNITEIALLAEFHPLYAFIAVSYTHLDVYKRQQPM